MRTPHEPRGPAATTRACGGAAVGRTAATLMASTIATSIMGFAFWIVVARWYPVEVVGRASALIASMTLIASVAQINLVNFFARFLPTAGGRTTRWVTVGFTTVAVTAGLLASAFLALRLDGGLAGAGWGFASLFVASAALATVSYVADGVVTSLGRVHWVPLKNAGTVTKRLPVSVSSRWRSYGCRGPVDSSASTARAARSRSSRSSPSAPGTRAVYPAALRPGRSSPLTSSSAGHPSIGQY